MPIHDWSNVNDGMFHWFHQRWIGSIANGSTVAGCRKASMPSANFTPMRLSPMCWPSKIVRRNGPGQWASSKGFGVALPESPPKTRFTWEAEKEWYLPRKISLPCAASTAFWCGDRDRLAGQQIEPGAVPQIPQKTIELLDQGVHVIVIDFFPPTPRDPQGIHQAIWSEKYDGDSTSIRQAVDAGSYRATTADSSPARSSNRSPSASASRDAVVPVG